MPTIDDRIELRTTLTKLNESDKIVVRVVEDLLLLLVKNQTISRTDIPEIVWSKVVERRKLRLKLYELQLKLGELA
jgi:hypothetical protein